MKRNLVLLELSCLELRSFQLFLLLSESWSRFRFEENQENFFPLERKKKIKRTVLCVAAQMTFIITPSASSSFLFMCLCVCVWIYTRSLFLLFFFGGGAWKTQRELIKNNNKKKFEEKKNFIFQFLSSADFLLSTFKKKKKFCFDSIDFAIIYKNNMIIFLTLWSKCSFIF